ncbi:MAG: hypothetical protein ACJASQ_003109 [Crocinitomicaceae bacterium]|jgi:hypothetical protein
MNLKKSLVLLGLTCTTGFVTNAQQYVKNSSFEDGPVVTNNSQIANADYWHLSDFCTPFANPGGFNTADLVDRNTPGTNYSVPLNFWAGNLDERTAQDRYAHLHARYIGNINSQFEEYMTGELNAALPQGCYNFTVWVARGVNAEYHAPSSLQSIIKAELVSDLGNCPVSVKPIFTSSNITAAGWTQLSISFNISAGEAGIYDHIKLKAVVPTSTHEYAILIDDVEINGSTPVSVTANTTKICAEGASYAVLNATGGSNYTWSPTATILGPTTGSQVTVDPLVNTTYTVTSNNGGCTSTASVLIETVHTNDLMPNPALSSPYSICTPTSTFPTICIGNPATNVIWGGPSGSGFGTCYTPTIPGNYVVQNQFLPTNATGGDCSYIQTFDVIEDCNPSPACMSFDGTNDCLLSQTNALNNIGTGTFTFEATINGVEANQGAHPMIFSNGAVSLFFHNVWNGSFTKMLCLQIGGANYLIMNNGTFNANILDGECHHIAISRKVTKGNQLSFYIDGQLIGTKSLSGNPSTAGGPLSIGKYSSNALHFEGSISQVRIWDVARNQADIFANMNTPIAVQSGLTAYFELNDGSGQVADNLVDSFDAQLGSTTGVDANDPAWNADCCVTAAPAPVACMTVDGVNDYLTSQTPALNNIGTGDFTFEMEVNGVNADQGHHPMLFANGTIALFFHNNWGGSFTRMLCLQIGGGNYFLMNNGTFNANILDGTCHHVAVRREGSLLSFYIDGQLAGTRTLSGNPTVSGGTLNIAKYSSNAYHFEGSLSQFRIWDVARSQADIAANTNVSLPNQNGLTAYFELNDGTGQIADNKVDSFEAQLGSTSGVDVNDPTWTVDCCGSEKTDQLANARSEDETPSTIETAQFSPNGLSIAQDITIFPNPNNGVFEISFFGIDADATVEIYNVAGKLIESRLVSNPRDLNFDLSQQAKGMYLIKVGTDQQVISKLVAID